MCLSINKYQLGDKVIIVYARSVLAQDCNTEEQSKFVVKLGGQVEIDWQVCELDFLDKLSLKIGKVFIGSHLYIVKL